MKRFLSFLLCIVLLVSAALPAMAYQRRHHRHHHRRHAHTYYDYRGRRTFWQKHRDKLTLAGGTAGGAMIGGLAGGKKGAGIGALAGAGGSALYTYKIRKRHRRY